MVTALSLLVVLGQIDGGVTFTLEGLIDRARSNDGRVKQAQAELRVLRGKYDEAKWAWFPKLEASMLVAGPTPEARNDGLGGPPTTRATLMYDLDFGRPGVMLGADISGVLPIYTFGKLAALEQLAASGVEVGRGLMERAQAEAELQAAQAYWAYQFAREGRATLVETLERLDKARASLERLRQQKSDQVTQMDVYKLDFYRNQVESRLAFADSGATFAIAAVRLLAAVPQGTSIRLSSEDLPEPLGALRPVTDYVGVANDHRPELRAMAAGIVAREREVFIRERMFLPDFGLGGFARWRWTTSATRQRSPFAYDPYNDLSAGLALVGRYSFDVPQKMAQLEQARGELEKLHRQRELLQQGIRLEIEKAHADLSDALSRAVSQAESEKSARRWATAAYASFDLGTTDTRELIDSFTALGVSSAERLRAWFEVQVGFRALAKAVGTSNVVPVFGREPAATGVLKP